MPYPDDDDDRDVCDECGSVGRCHPNCSFVRADLGREALDQAEDEARSADPPVDEFTAFLHRCAADCVNARWGKP